MIFSETAAAPPIVSDLLSSGLLTAKMLHVETQTELTSKQHVSTSGQATCDVLHFALGYWVEDVMFIPSDC